MKKYNKLLRILSASNDNDKMIEFCKKNFIQANRPIESITEKEIEELGKSENIFDSNCF